MKSAKIFISFCISQRNMFNYWVEAPLLYSWLTENDISICLVTKWRIRCYVKSMKKMKCHYLLKSWAGDRYTWREVWIVFSHNCSFGLGSIRKWIFELVFKCLYVYWANVELNNKRKIWKISSFQWLLFKINPKHLATSPRNTPLESPSWRHRGIQMIFLCNFVIITVRVMEYLFK